MSENKIKFPVKLASNNPQSFGIADATEISGHRSVDALSDLYAISDPVLSILKDGSDAIGQEWFVVSEDCKYRLDNWENRKSIAGWTKLPKQELINIKQSVSEKDQQGGYAGLDSNGKLPIEKTYGYTATVVEVETYELLPAAGSSGVIYYVSNTSAQYKWSGSAYIDITDGADNAKKNETSIFDCSNGTSTKYYSSLSAAINVVPPVYRTSNRIISYLSTESSPASAVNYQFHGIDSTTWADLTKWERIPNQTDLAEIRSDLNKALYDVSSHNDGAVFESLSSLLNHANLSTLIPTSVRCGGMSIQFIQGAVPNSDNKYIQARCMAQNFTTDATQWSIAEEGVYVESPEFVYVKTDKDNKILWGIKIDGEFLFGAGCPKQVKDYIEEKISSLSLDEYEDIATFLSDYLGSDTTLKAIIDEINATKLDKEGLDPEALGTVQTIEDHEYIQVVTDNEDKILEGITTDGIKVENLPIETPSVITESLQNSEWISVTTDKDGRIIEGITSEGKRKVMVETEVEKLSINGNILEDTKNSDFVYSIEDTEGRVLFCINKCGEVEWLAGTPAPIKEYIDNVVKENNAYTLNERQEKNIYSAARFLQDNKTQDFQTILIGDPHCDVEAIKRAFNIANQIKSIESVIILGDIIGWAPFDSNVNSFDGYNGGFYTLINTIIPKECKKNWYLVPGNHDVGPTPFVAYSRTDEEVYNDMIKPMIDNGMLRSGEYNTSENYADRCYYYHDFNNRKVRLIVLYEYGWRQELADNQYWEPVTYNADAPQIQENKTYTYDANNPVIVNCHGYKNYSFQLKKTVTTFSQSTSVFSDTMPRFKCTKGYQIFTKKQLEWFASVLNSTPDGYGIVIASHQQIMNRTDVTNNKFSIGSNPDNTFYPRANGNSYDQLTDNIVIPKIIDAWKNKTTLSEKVAAIAGYTLEEIGDPRYLNVLEDGGYKYMYELNLDFTQRTNNNTYFASYICGHEHCDMVERSKDFTYQYGIVATTPNPPYRTNSDIANVRDLSSPAYDSLTIYSVGNKNRIALCKYGNDRTVAGVVRDFELINVYQ